MKGLSDWAIEFLWENSIGRVISLMILIILIIILAVAGVSIGSMLLGLILIPFAIFLGYLSEFVGSIIFCVLLRFLHNDLVNLLQIWGDFPKITNTFDFLLNHGLMKSIIIVFFVTFTISFFTSRIKLFNIKSSSSNQINKKEEKEKREEE